MKFSRSLKLHLAGIAAIAVLSGCGNGGNPLALSPDLDTTPPPAPQNLTLSGDAYGHPALVWSASAAIDVIGYQVYVYAAGSGGADDFVPADDVVCLGTSFTLPTGSTSVQASYRVRALDAAGNWSGYSETANILIPATDDPFEIQ